MPLETVLLTTEENGSRVGENDLRMDPTRREVCSGLIVCRLTGTTTSPFTRTMLPYDSATLERGPSGVVGVVKSPG
jgi:hypothetical protein